jgi:hypothetical protein
MRRRSQRVFNNFQAKFFNEAAHKVTVLRCVVPDKKFYADDDGAVCTLSYPLYILRAVVIGFCGFSHYLASNSLALI